MDVGLALSLTNYIKSWYRDIGIEDEIGWLSIGSINVRQTGYSIPFSFPSDLDIFVYGSAECAIISLECTKVKLLVLNNFGSHLRFALWTSLQQFSWGAGPKPHSSSHTPLASQQVEDNL